MKPKKRTTIYDIAQALDIHPTYVSKALNAHPSINAEMIEKVRQKATEMRYRHNSIAANLRTRQSRIIGVVVPKIDERFFSKAIAGMEEVCTQNDHHLIICQTQESYRKEVEAIETLIRQNVDAIIISLSLETRNSSHLQEALAAGIALVQFDRYDESILSMIVRNDNREAAYRAVRHLFERGYERIAYIGGPDHLKTFMERKQGFIDAIREADSDIPYHFTAGVALEREQAKQIALELLRRPMPPDAFFTASDMAALGVLQAAAELNIAVPDTLGIVGFQYEDFTQFVTPTLSTVNQKSMEMGRMAALAYFESVNNKHAKHKANEMQLVRCELVINRSSAGIKRSAA